MKKRKGERDGGKTDLLRGTLQLLVLKTLALEPMHGLGVARRIHQISRGTFDVSLGSLFPVLHRMEQLGWIEADWRPSETGRRAKYYTLTRDGSRRLREETRHWDRVSTAIGWILEAT